MTRKKERQETKKKSTKKKKYQKEYSPGRLSQEMTGANVEERNNTIKKRIWK